MADRKASEVRELRLEGAGLFLIVAVLGAGLIGAFFLGRWYERSSAPPAGLERLASDPLANVVAPDQIEDVDLGANRFDTLEGATEAEPARQATPPAPTAAEESSPPARRPEPAPSVGGGPFFVQIAAFRDRGSADRVVAELRDAGYSVSVFPEDGPSGQLFKVRVGGYDTRDKAAAIAAELKTKGHAGAFTTKVD
jgi:cell division septation protein DedD